MQTETIPQGYMRRHNGDLVPIENVRPIDIEKDKLVRELVEHGQALSEMLADYKKRCLNDIQAFVQLSAERYNVKIGGDKGNVTLRTFDGSFSICRDIAERIEFDEGLKAAEALIGECLTEWTKDSRPEIRTIITQAFQTDKAGNISTARVLGLRKLDIQDEKWQRAMTAISESVTITGSRAYIRIYSKIDGKETQIPIDLASV